ncbi:SPOR domain-containing protein [Phaeobacter sp. CNT1-3]|jgi:cell division septation protein DedD|nr:SPOR domain-containing protein [Phaeobacter sp. CNT1-3]
MIKTTAVSKRSGAARLGLILAGAALTLSACQDGANGSLFAKAPREAAADSVTLVERDIEAPDVFQQTEAGLWDGRPSLGGVWVAHPDVSEPERVIIRNEANGKFVIGALFRRERANPGPRFQTSSDAAAALSMLAGQPVQLSVTALRREEVPSEAPVAPPADQVAAAAKPIEEKALDPISSAAAAIDNAEAKAKPASTAAAAPKPAPNPAPKPAASGLKKPFLQLGIFSVKANAEKAANQMEAAGMPSVLKEASLKGKTYWRVLVGPAQTSAERTSLLNKIKAKGFADAYAVRN